MKKIIYVIMIMCMLMSTSYADNSWQDDGGIKFSDYISEEEQSISSSFDTFVIDGTTYVYNKHGAKRSHIVPYDESLSQIMYLDYVITDDYYLARDCHEAIAFYIAHPTNTLLIYDKNLNLLHEEDFGGRVYVDDMGYCDGVFYASYRERYYIRNDENGNEYVERAYAGDEHAEIRQVTVKSTDMINWVETDEEIPISNSVASIRNGETDVANNTMSSISYEKSNAFEYFKKFGDYFIILDYNEKSIYLTNDNVYLIKLNSIPLRDIGMSRITEYQLFEFNNNIVFYLDDDSYYTMPIGDLYDKLHALDNAYYVVMNNEVLGFEHPPVIENDRTLVPIRFFFEQMGATVEWEEGSRSAIVTLGDKSITFSIDDHVAYVNGEAITMDVPARLINDKTMVPLRFLSENLGLTVTWDEETRTATIE